jgi:hypothetical protein
VVWRWGNGSLVLKFIAASSGGVGEEETEAKQN